MHQSSPISPCFNPPFGSAISEMQFKSDTGGGYRYTFNGKETDIETDLQDYGFRIYNPSIGKFLSVDPLADEYPWYTPYQFAGNMPIWAIDLDGLEPFIPGGLMFFSRPTPIIRPIVETVVKTNNGRYVPNSSLSRIQNLQNAARNGRLNHFERQTEWTKQGFEIEQTLGSGNRLDGIQILRRVGYIKELKPNSLSGIRRGISQLNRYAQAAIKEFPDIKEWNLELELYSQVYVIQPGDNLTKISAKFGTSIENIIKLNGIADKNKINAGAQIVVNIYLIEDIKNKNYNSGTLRDNTSLYQNIHISDEVLKKNRDQMEERKKQEEIKLDPLII
jgi:RHS repeat-associated protein